MKLFHVISVSFERSFIMSIKLCLNSFKTTLLHRERRDDRAERRKMKEKRSNEECSLQIIELRTQAQFILSWQRFSFISFIWTKMPFFSPSLMLIPKCSHKLSTCSSITPFVWHFLLQEVYKLSQRHEFRFTQKLCTALWYMIKLNMSHIWSIYYY